MKKERPQWLQAFVVGLLPVGLILGSGYVMWMSFLSGTFYDGILFLLMLGFLARMTHDIGLIVLIRWRGWKEKQEGDKSGF